MPLNTRRDGKGKRHGAFLDVKLAESSVCLLSSLDWLLTLMGWKQQLGEAFFTQIEPNYLGATAPGRHASQTPAVTKI